MIDTKSPEHSTFICGLFDIGGRIEEHVNFKTTVTNLKANILKIGYIPAPVTSLKGVSKIPAGEFLVVSKTDRRFEKLFPNN